MPSYNPEHQVISTIHHSSLLSDSLVYKITEPLKVPKIVIFTKDTKLIHHMHLHGYIVGNSLTSQLIAFIGQQCSKELLNQHLLQQSSAALEQQLIAASDQLDKDKDNVETNTIQLKKLKAKITELEQKVKQQKKLISDSQFNYRLISDLQKKILQLSREEQKISFSDFEKQREFKNKLSEFILESIKLNKQYYKILTPNAMQQLLSNAISLVYSFKFPTTSIINSDTTFSQIDQKCFFPLQNSADTDKNKYQRYLIEPEKYSRITNAHDRTQLYATLNAYQGNDLSHNIPTANFDPLTTSTNTYTFSLENIFKWLYKNKYQIALFALFVALESAFLIPALSPLILTVNLLKLVGLSNSILIWTTLVPLNITTVNFIFSYKAHFKQAYYWLLSKFIKLKLPEEYSINESRLMYDNLLKFREDLYLRKTRAFKPSNILWHIPVLSHIVTFIENFYEKYTMNYFANVHRFPLGFSLSYFLSVTPLGKAIKLLINSFIQLTPKHDDRTNLQTFDCGLDGRMYIPALSVDLEAKINKGYIILRRNIFGQYECYRQDTLHHYRTLTEEELLHLVNDIRLNKNEKTKIFCFNNFRWSLLRDTDFQQQLLGAQNITLPDPDYWQPAPSLFSRIYTSLKLYMLTSLIKQILIDSLKILFIKLPVIILYTLVNKLLLTTLYFVVFLALNIIAIPIRIFGNAKLNDLIVNLGFRIFNIYYKVYYNKLYTYLDRFNNYIESKDSYSLKAHQIESTIKGYNTPQLAWLEKNHPDLYKKAKKLEALLTISDIDDNDYNKQLKLTEFKEQTKQLLINFYDDATKFYYNQKSAKPRIATNSYLMLLEKKLQQITQQVDVLKFYLSSSDKFQKSYSDQNPFEYMKTVIKIKSAMYFCNPMVDQKERDVIDKFIKALPESAQSENKTHDDELMFRLYNLFQDRGLSSSIKQNLIKPCINQAQAIYGSKIVKLMTRLRDSRFNPTIKNHEAAETQVSAPRPARLRARSASL